MGAGFVGEPQARIPGLSWPLDGRGSVLHITQAVERPHVPLSRTAFLEVITQRSKFLERGFGFLHDRSQVPKAGPSAQMSEAASRLVTLHGAPLHKESFPSWLFYSRIPE